MYRTNDVIHCIDHRITGHRGRLANFCDHWTVADQRLFPRHGYRHAVDRFFDESGTYQKLYLSALVIALIGMVLCALAPNFPIMMMSRILQAIGNGILISMARVILLTIYPMDRIGAIMGWYKLSITAAPVIAPTLAGMIVDKLNWHAIFYIVGAIVFVSLIWALNVFEDVLDVTKKKFDLLSFLLSAVTFGGFTLDSGI